MRRRLRSRWAIVSLALLVSGAVSGALGGMASAGPQPPIDIGNFVVDKAVEGTQPSGSQFTISFNCTEQEDTPNPPQQVVLNGPGNAVDTMAEADDGGYVDCTVSEPGTGGASSIEFACAVQGSLAECLSDSSVRFSQPEDSAGLPIGTITITNAYKAPAAVIATAPLTG